MARITDIDNISQSRKPECNYLYRHKQKCNTQRHKRAYKPAHCDSRLQHVQLVLEVRFVCRVLFRPFHIASLFNARIRMPLRFSSAAGFPSVMRLSVLQPSICAQPAQVLSFLSRTQLCIGQSASQNGVFSPSTRQRKHRSISVVIYTPFGGVPRAAVCLRSSPSFVIAAILAWHFSQSSPQQPIRSFTGIPPCNSYSLSFGKNHAYRKVHCLT